MNKKFIKAITLFLSIIMLIGSFSGIVFAEESIDPRIEKLVEEGYIVGYSDGKLGLNRNITRGEFSAIVARALGLEEHSVTVSGIDSGFSDVKTSHWSNGYLNAIKERHIIKGYPDGTFKPDKNMSYEEAASILARVLLTKEEANIVNTGKWPNNYTNKARELNILNNVNGFKVGETATRETVFLMLSNTVETLKERGIIEDKTTEISALVLESGEKVSLIVVEDSGKFKKGNTLNFKNSDNINIETHFVYELKVTDSGDIKAIEKSKKSEVYSGKVEKVRDGLKLDKKTYDSKDLLSLTLNREEVEYSKFPRSVENAKASIYDGELLVVDAFDFEETVFIQSIKNSRVHGINLKGEQVVVNAGRNTTFFLIENGNKTEVKIGDIKEKDVLHIEESRRDSSILIIRSSDEGKLNSIDNKSTSFKIEEKEYRLSSAEALLIQDRRFSQIKDISALRNLTNSKVKVYLDVNGDVQFIEVDKNVVLSDKVLVEKVNVDSKNNSIEVLNEFGIRDRLYVTSYTEVFDANGRHLTSNRYGKNDIADILGHLSEGLVVNIAVDSRGELEEIVVMDKSKVEITYLDFDVIEVNKRDIYLSESIVVFEKINNSYKIIDIDDLEELSYRNKDFKMSAIIFEEGRVVEAIIVQGLSFNAKEDIEKLLKENSELLEISEALNSDKDIKNVLDKVNKLKEGLKGMKDVELEKALKELKADLKTLELKTFEASFGELSAMAEAVKSFDKVYNKEELNKIVKFLEDNKNKKETKVIVEIVKHIEEFEENVYGKVAEIDKKLEGLDELLDKSLKDVNSVLDRVVYNQSAVQNFKTFLTGLSNEIQNIKDVDEVTMWESELNNRAETYKSERFNISGKHSNFIEVFHFEEKIEVAKKLLAKEENASLKKAISDAEKLINSFKRVEDGNKINLEKLESERIALRKEIVELARIIDMKEIKDANIKVIIEDGNKTRVNLIASGKVDEALALNEILLELRAYGISGVEETSINRVVEEIETLLSGSNLDI